jgi:hypothetical protein
VLYSTGFLLSFCMTDPGIVTFLHGNPLYIPDNNRIRIATQNNSYSETEKFEMLGNQVKMDFKFTEINFTA